MRFLKIWLTTVTHAILMLVAVIASICGLFVGLMYLCVFMGASPEVAYMVSFPTTVILSLFTSLALAEYHSENQISK